MHTSPFFILANVSSKPGTTWSAQDTASYPDMSVPIASGRHDGRMQTLVSDAVFVKSMHEFKK